MLLAVPHLQEKPMPQLFISHATEDADFAQRIARSMRAANVDVWLAPNSIHPGEDFVDAIQRGLSGTTHLVVIMSPAAIESSWVKLEMNTGIRLERGGKLSIMPISYRACEPPVLWGAYHWAEYGDNYDGLVEKLLRWMGVCEVRSWVRPRPLEADELARRQAALEEIAAEVLVCRSCPLHLERLNAVPGQGPANAQIFFVGESPGPEDDNTGIPFVSAAGEFLGELLDLINLPREDVYLTNILKCRPHQNRDPQASEMNACAGYLRHQIEVIDPRIIVTLGRFALNRMLPGAKISKIHGQLQEATERFIMPMYHPAAALYRQRYRTILIQDFLAMGELLDNPENLS
jgi:uracil-DNA glycosylase family 4